MNPEKRHLIHELLDPQRDAHGEAILLAAGRTLRRRRRRRWVVRHLTAVTILTLLAFSLARLVPRHSPMTTVPAPLPADESSAQELTDAELLDLFPDTPVGLVTLDNGAKRLIFPRPGDEARFVKSL
jgi:hypothetical protein